MSALFAHRSRTGTREKHGQKGVLIVDDDADVRSSLRRLFESHPEFQVSGEAVDGRDAIDEAERLKPDLIILDLAMAVMTGLEAAPLLRKMLPDTALILFTPHDGHPVELLAKAAGIHAVVPKRQAASRLIAVAQALLAEPPGSTGGLTLNNSATWGVHVGIKCERCEKVYFPATTGRIDFARSFTAIREYRLNCSSPCNAVRLFLTSDMQPYSVSAHSYKRGYACWGQYQELRRAG